MCNKIHLGLFQDVDKASFTNDDKLFFCHFPGRAHVLHQVLVTVRSLSVRYLK